MAGRYNLIIFRIASIDGRQCGAIWRGDARKHVPGVPSELQESGVFSEAAEQESLQGECERGRVYQYGTDKPCLSCIKPSLKWL